MKEWKIRQQIWHDLNKQYTDDLNEKELIIDNSNILDDCVKYIKEEDVPWLYPAKSYLVGICYAYWIFIDFGDEFYETLNDPELLYNNDPYFKPYSEDKFTYDKIINIFKLPLPNTGVVPHIRKYYEEEILLKSDINTSK